MSDKMREALERIAGVESEHGGWGWARDIARAALAKQPAQGQNDDGLLPCPFCGADARFDWQERRGQNFYYAVCPKDECVARLGTDYCKTKEAAAAIWNRREAQQPAQGEAVAEAEVESMIGRLLSSDVDFIDCEDAVDLIRRLAAPSAPAVPDGWKLVPIKPTPEMWQRMPCASEREWLDFIDAAPEAMP